MPGLDCADRALETPSTGADAVVLVTEWPEFLALDWRAVAAAMARQRRHRRAQRPRRARPCAPPGSSTRASGGRMSRRRDDAGGDPRRRRGHAAAAADLARRQAGRHARRPAVHRLHARVAAPPRRRRRRPLPAASCADRVRERARRRRRATACACATSRSPSRSAPAARCATPRSCSTSASSSATATSSPTSTSAPRSPSTSAPARPATLALIAVEDPSAYGLVRCDADGAVARVRREAAGPTRLDTNLISAGAYVLERCVLDLIAPRARRLDRARGLAGADRQRPLRLRRPTATGSTSGPRALPAGDLRHHRRQCRPGRRPARRRWPSATRPSSTGA